MHVTVVQCLNCEKKLAERWERGAKGAETNAEGVRGGGKGEGEGNGEGVGCPLPNRLRDLGSVVSSPSGVRGRAPAENEFDVFCGR